MGLGEGARARGGKGLSIEPSFAADKRPQLMETEDTESKDSSPLLEG